MAFYGGGQGGMKDALKTASDRRIADRQVGVPVATIAGSTNGNPDMRKFYSDYLAQSMPTTNGVNGMQCSFITNIMGNQFFMPGDPLVKFHTTTSDLGGTAVYTQADQAVNNIHSQSELLPGSCNTFVAPPDGPFPWVYYHTIGDGLPPGYYYFLSQFDGPHPGKGPGWPS